MCLGLQVTVRKTWFVVHYQVFHGQENKCPNPQTKSQKFSALQAKISYANFK